MKRIPPIDVRNIHQMLIDVMFLKLNVPTNLRRQQIVDIITLYEDNINPNGLLVNANGCVNIRRDRDVRYLIKRGRLSVHRIDTRHSFPHCAHTFIRVVR